MQVRRDDQSRPADRTCLLPIQPHSSPHLKPPIANNTQGVSYTLSTQSLPSLLTLPSAQPAAYTLAQTTRLAALHTATLSGLSLSALGLAFALSPPRIRHPYLLWTALVAGCAGAVTLRADAPVLLAKQQSQNQQSGVEINGEQVERAARERQVWEFVRTGVSAVGFAMAVVGIWGDGA